MTEDYDNIPLHIRNHLDDLYTPEGVEVWWNARNAWLNSEIPRDLWETPQGRNRVWQLVEILESGAFS